MIEGAPFNPGIYKFIDKNEEIIYVGKAKILKNRLSNYFGTGLARKTMEMVSNAARVEWVITESEFEAIILEAELIKKFQPKYNSQLKDDKSNLYITLSRDKYPIVGTARKHQLEKEKFSLIVGPFTSGKTAKKILRLIRRIVPYATHLPDKKPCLYFQMGLCSPCPSELGNSDQETVKSQIYNNNIKKLKKILRGKVQFVYKELVKEMNDKAKHEEFEKAGEIQKQLATLDYILNPSTNIESYIDNPNLSEDIRESEKVELEKLLKPFFKKLNLETIECFDCAHLAGTHRTASRVTFVNGVADKSKYRHYKVRYAKRADDYSSLKEVLKRRKLAGDLPDLMVIDGGKGQVSTVMEEISEVPVIGLAKRFESVIIKQGNEFITLRPEGPALRLLQRMRDEAHRFAEDIIICL